MANKVILSEQFKLQSRDFFWGAILAVGAAIVPIIQESITKGDLTFDWKSIGVTASGTFVAYVAKKFFDPAKVITQYKTNAKATAVANDIKKS